MTDIEVVITGWSARLDEQERIARAIDNKQFDSGWAMEKGSVFVGGPGWAIRPHVGCVYETEAAEHIVANGPDVVLADIAAKRKVIADYRVLMDSFESQPDEESALISEGERNALEGVIRTIAGTTTDANE